MRRQIINWKRPLHPARAQARSVVADFGRNVRARRLAAGLRQTDLARICHVGPAFICAIERGQSNPSLETMALVANGLGCHVTDLLRDIDTMRHLRADEIKRAHDALDELQAILMPEKAQP